MGNSGRKNTFQPLLEQAGCLPLSEKDSGLLRWLIGCLDNDGFLPESLEEIAQAHLSKKKQTPRIGALPSPSCKASILPASGQKMSATLYCCS